MITFGNAGAETMKFPLPYPKHVVGQINSGQAGPRGSDLKCKLAFDHRIHIGKERLQSVVDTIAGLRIISFV